MARPFGNARHRNRPRPAMRTCPPTSAYGSDPIVNRWAHDVASDDSWCDEFASNDCWGNWAALVLDPHVKPGVTVDDDPPLVLNRTERRFINRHAALIVNVSSDGFVSVDWYDSADQARADWENLAEAIDPTDEDEDD